MEIKYFNNAKLKNKPKDWKVEKLNNIFNVYGGTTPSTSNVEFWNGEIPWVTPTDITKIKNNIFLDKTEKRITEKAIKACSLDILDKGTLLLTSRATIGEVVINKIPVTINQGMTALIPKKSEEIYTMFYAYYLQTLKPYLIQLGSGSTFREISKSSLKNIILPVLSFKEQKKISEILLSVDESIEEVSKAIAKTEKLKNGLMHKLLRNGIGHKEFKDTEIGKIPKDWKVVNIVNVADINQESRNPSNEIHDKYFFYIDIDSVENETGVIQNVKEILGSKAPSRARRVIHYNNLIMSTVRPYLKAFAVIPEIYDNQICSTGFAVFNCRENISPYYLFYILFSKNVLTQFNKMMVGAQYPALNNSQVKKIKIPIPPITEQGKIAEMLSAIDGRLKLLKSKKEKLVRVKKGLMNDLFSGEKRVKLETLS